ncbi:unnamed protein product, partial [Iphiclides podalirius]
MHRAAEACLNSCTSVARGALRSGLRGPIVRAKETAAEPRRGEGSAHGAPIGGRHAAPDRAPRRPIPTLAHHTTASPSTDLVATQSFYTSAPFSAVTADAQARADQQIDPLTCPP